MGKIFTREECLQIDIEAYNRAVELSWRKDIVAKNLSGRLSDCKYCGRKYVVCCICDEAVGCIDCRSPRDFECDR